MNTQRWMKPKNYVFFKAVESGVLFEAGHKNFVLQGKGIYPLIAKIIHFMDAGHCIDDIVAKLPPKLAPFAVRVLEELAANDMLIDGTAEQAIAERYANQDRLFEFVKFLQDNLGESYEAELARWQSDEVWVVGNGYSAKAAIKCLAEAGVGKVVVGLVSADTVLPGRDELLAALFTRAEQDDNFQFELIEPARLHDRLADNTEKLTLYAADSYSALADFFAQPNYPRIVLQPYMVATALADHGLVSPLNEAGCTNFLDVYQRLAATETQDTLHSPASCALLGALAAFNAIKHYFAIDTRYLRNHCAYVSPHLEVDYRPVLPSACVNREHPLAPVKYAVPFEQPEGRPVSDYEHLLMVLAPLYDAHLGVLSNQPALALAQLPLYHDALRLRYAQGLQLADEQLLAWGTSAEDAGVRALMRALAQLAAREQGQSHQPVVAGVNADTWRARATALALLISTDGDALASARINPDDLAVDAVHMLVRILKLYSAADLHLDVYWTPGMPAVGARVVCDGQLLGVGYADSLAQAALEALGASCSQQQFPDWPQLSPVDHLRKLAAPTARITAQALQTQLAQTPPQNFTVQEHRLAPLFDTNAYVVGWVSVGEADHTETIDEQSQAGSE